MGKRGETDGTMMDFTQKNMGKIGKNHWEVDQQKRDIMEYTQQYGSIFCAFNVVCVCVLVRLKMGRNYRDTPPNRSFNGEMINQQLLGYPILIGDVHRPRKTND